MDSAMAVAAARGVRPEAFDGFDPAAELAESFCSPPLDGEGGEGWLARPAEPSRRVLPPTLLDALNFLNFVTFRRGQAAVKVSN